MEREQLLWLMGIHSKGSSKKERDHKEEFGRRKTKMKKLKEYTMKSLSK